MTRDSLAEQPVLALCGSFSNLQLGAPPLQDRSILQYIALAVCRLLIANLRW